MTNSYQKLLRLEYISIIYNLFEAYLFLLSGSMANSIALIGFGLNEAAEMIPALIIIGRLSLMQEKKNNAKEENNRSISGYRGKIMIPIFLGLGSFLVYQSIHGIILGKVAGSSLLGLIIVLLSLFVTPILTLQKYKTAGNDLKSIIAGLKGSFLYIFLLFLLLVSLTVNFFGITGTDPVIGIILGLVIIGKGIKLIF